MIPVVDGVLAGLAVVIPFVVGALAGLAVVIPFVVGVLAGLAIVIPFVVGVLSLIVVAIPAAVGALTAVAGVISRIVVAVPRIGGVIPGAFPARSGAVRVSPGVAGTKGGSLDALPANLAVMRILDRKTPALSRGILAVIAVVSLCGACDVGGKGKKSSAASARRGWLPDSAVEATKASDLRANPESDPLCQDKGSPIDVGKALAISIERELRESTKVSDAEELRIGKHLESSIARERSFVGKWDLPDDVRTYGKYLGGLVQHIAKGRARTGISYRVHIVRRPEFNAAALPGGVLMVYTGLLEGPQAVRDEAELVGVLGHEIAHVEKRHTIAAYQYAKAVLGSTADQGAIAMKVLTLPLSTERELEADEHGLELGIKAQYDPQASVNLWKRRAAGERPSFANPLGDILDSLTRSHPRASVRACRAMAKVRWAHDHSPWDRLYDGKTSFRTRVMGPTRPH